MTWRIEISPAADRELTKLGPQAARRIVSFLHERIACLDDPRSIGKPLRGPQLGNFWRYRVGDYRIVAHIEDDVFLILVLRVGNRKSVYR